MVKARQVKALIHREQINTFPHVRIWASNFDLKKKRERV